MFLNQNIRYLRKRENLSQEDFANLFGLNRSNIGSYEEGRAVPPLEILLKIAKHFTISLEQLIEKDISVETLSLVMGNNSAISEPAPEIASHVIKSDFFARALLQSTFEIIDAWAEVITPEMKNMILAELPKMLSEKYRELLIKEQNIPEDLAERLVQELKESLNLF